MTDTGPGTSHLIPSKSLFWYTFKVAQNLDCIFFSVTDISEGIKIRESRLGLNKVTIYILLDYFVPLLKHQYLVSRTKYMKR